MSIVTSLALINFTLVFNLILNKIIYDQILWSIESNTIDGIRFVIAFSLILTVQTTFIQ